jgi:hypothetical protein
MAENIETINVELPSIKEDRWAGWSHTELIKVKLKNEFLAWIVYMAIQIATLFFKLVPNEFIGKIITWSGIVTVCFIFYCPLKIAISNMKINAELKAGIYKEIKKILEGKL